MTFQIGLNEHSTNFRSLTGDALDISKKHGVELEHLDYVQIHPTVLYSKALTTPNLQLSST